MSDAANKQIPLINEAAQSGDDELNQIMGQARIQALVGQRDEALLKAAELFARLTVMEHVAKKLEAENAELKLDLDALKQQVGLPAAS